MKKQILLEDLEAIKRMKSGPRDSGKPMFTTKVTKKLPKEPEAEPKDDSEGEIGVAPVEEPKIEPEKKDDKPQEKPVVEPEEPEVPPLVVFEEDRVPDWNKEIVLGEGLQKFTIVNQNLKPDPGGENTSAISYQRSSQDLNALAILMRQAKYPLDCIDFLLDANNWALFMTYMTAVGSFVGFNTFGFGSTSAFLRGYGASDLKKLPKFFKNKFSGLGAKNKVVVATGAIVAIIGGGMTVKTMAGLLNQASSIPTSLFDFIKKWLKTEETDCAAQVYFSLTAVAATIGFFAVSGASGALGRRARGLTGRYGSEAVDLFLKIFRKKGIKAAEETKEIVKTSTKQVTNKEQDFLETAAPEVQDFFNSFAELVSQPGITMKDVKKYMNDLPFQGSDQLKTAEKVVEDIFSTIETNYRSVAEARKIEAFRLFSKNQKRYEKSAGLYRKQAGFNFDEIVDGASVPKLSKLMDSAFDENDIETGYQLLNKITETARSRGILEGPLRDKEALAELALKAEKKALGNGVNVSSTQALSFLLDEVTTNASKIKVDAQEFNKLIETTVSGADTKLTEAAASAKLQKRVNDIVFQANKDLQEKAFDKQLAQEVVEKTVKVAEEVAEQSLKAMKKADSTTKTIIKLETATLVAAAVLIKGSQLLKFPEPTGAPWFFEEGSEFSFVNGLKGRQTYKNLEAKVFASDEAATDFFNFITSGSDVIKSKNDAFIAELATIDKSNIPEDLNDFIRNKLKEFADLHKQEISETLEGKHGIKNLYGTENPKIINRKRQEMLTIVSELFLLNSEFENDLVKYFDDVMQRNPGPAIRKQKLEEIFNFQERNVSALSRFNTKKQAVKKHVTRHTGKGSSAPLSSASAEGVKIGNIALGELRRWKGLDENDAEALLPLKDYVLTTKAVRSKISDVEFRQWVNDNIRRESDPWAWSAVFIRWVTREAGQEVPSLSENMKASHRGYVEAAKKNTSKLLKSKKPVKDEWIYLPMFRRLRNLGDDELRNEGLVNKNIGYQPQIGDIIITSGGVASGYHGDILTSQGRVGGNVSNTVKVRSENMPMYGIVTNNPSAKSKLLQYISRAVADTKTDVKKEVKQMSKKDIKKLVAEVLNENYSKYHYNSNEHSESEPDEDYMVDWKALVDEVCDNKKRNLDGDPNTFEDPTIEVAKILVKDQDLFRDVLELAGSNKSVGVEILQQLKAVREKRDLGKESDV